MFMLYLTLLYQVHTLILYLIYIYIYFTYVGNFVHISRNWFIYVIDCWYFLYKKIVIMIILMYKGIVSALFYMLSISRGSLKYSCVVCEKFVVLKKTIGTSFMWKLSNKWNIICSYKECHYKLIVICSG